MKILQKISNIFCHIKIILQQQNKNCFKKIHHMLFNNQSIELTISNEIDIGNIIQEVEALSKKNSTGGLSEISRLINLAIRKKYWLKGKIDSLWTPRNITSLDGSCYEKIDSSVSQNFFQISKRLACNAEKNITIEDNKKSS